MSQVNHLFWQTAYKRNKVVLQSGWVPKIAGWVSLFFPYIRDDEASTRLSPYLTPWANAFDKTVRDGGYYHGWFLLVAKGAIRIR